MELRLKVLKWTIDNLINLIQFTKPDQKHSARMMN
jgi:hypothetical protein